MNDQPDARLNGRRRHRIVAVAVAVVAFGTLVPASSAQAWSITFKHRTSYNWTKIETWPCGGDFSVRVVIRRNGRVVFRHEMSECGLRYYHWRCRRAGWHRWVARGEGETRRGRFKVPECPTAP